jgi:hypothetical protein
LVAATVAIVGVDSDHSESPAALSLTMSAFLGSTTIPKRKPTHRVYEEGFSNRDDSDVYCLLSSSLRQWSMSFVIVAQEGCSLTLN